jgi:hypothetical protein
MYTVIVMANYEINSGTAMKRWFLSVFFNCKVLETVETVIVGGEEGGGSVLDEEEGEEIHLQEILVGGDLELEEEELVDDVEELLEEQVVVEDGVQYEIELE